VGSGYSGSGLDPRWVALIAAVGLITSFAIIERNTKHPLLRFGIFKNRQLLGANLIALLHPTGPLATLFFLSLFLQKTLSYAPLQAGLSFLPFAVCAAIGAIGVSQLSRTISLRMLMVFGFVLMAAGTLWLSRLPVVANYVIDILPGTMLVGLGITTAGVPMFISAVSHINTDEAGLAGALVNTFQQIGSALVLAILVSVASNVAESTNELEGWRSAFRVAVGLLVFAAMAAFYLFRPLTPSANKGTSS
jgi:predicted MFS family arabinose efflux permease